VTPARHASVVALLLSSTIGLSGCGLFGRDTVAVLGDSITAISRSEIDSALDNYDVHAVGKFGARVDQTFADAQALADEHPKKLVINLGTNDAIEEYPAATTGLSLEKILAMFADVKCIAIVTIDNQLTVYGQSRAAQAEAVNAQILRIVAAHPTVRLIDWNQIVATGGGLLTVTDDGVHPNDAGKRTLAAAYRSTLDACHA
jgi:lysophospholipase L1-like esterase